MPIPIRNLGSLGILMDPGPYDLPPNAFSSGINVRFNAKKLSRGPAFRTLKSAVSVTAPRFVLGVPPASGEDAIIYADNNGKVFRFSGGTSTDYHQVIDWTCRQVRKLFSAIHMGSGIPAATRAAGTFRYNSTTIDDQRARPLFQALRSCS